MQNNFSAKAHEVDGDHWAFIVGLAAIAVSTWLLSTSLKIEPMMVSRVFLFAITAFAWVKLLRGTRPDKRELAVFGIYSLLFDVTLVLGNHIEVGDGNPYSALKDTAYIIDYGIVDVVQFVGMYPSILILSLAVFRLPFYFEEHCGCFRCPERANGINRILFAAFSVLLFMSWIPYLITYYPGFIFGDTLSSLAQATGVASWSNHHPVMYTAFIAMCLNVAHLIGLGNAAGCALYCIIQMAFLACCFSYLSSWIVSRFALSCKTKTILIIIMFVYFGVNPYVASYGIAMWKDPIFSASLVVLTIVVADVIVFFKAVSPGRIALFGAFALIASFSRNNGVYIIILLIVCFAFVMLVDFLRKRRGSLLAGGGFSDEGYDSPSKRKTRRLSSLVLTGTAVAIMYYCVTGPVYSALGIIPSSSTESLGVPLNQMARVAAYDGEMTEGDRAYLDEVFPIERYADSYYPCCTDNLKWDPDFNGDALSNDFWNHWLSMLVKNPRAYFEAWELQTFGFWTVNQPAVWSQVNIGGGVPRTVAVGYSQDLAAYGIDPDVATQHSELRKLLPYEEQSVPVGVVFWTMIHLACCAIVLRQYRWIVVLLPSLGLMATLIIASPIWYWPRYAAAVQFLIPLFVSMYFLICAPTGVKCWNEGTTAFSRSTN